jgi:hypothetical protein
MEKFKHFIVLNKDLTEQSYPNNQGFEEMVKFYQTANSSQLKKMEIIIKNEDWDGFKKLIKKVSDVTLK